MATTLAQIGITPATPGWLAKCATCGWESYHPRRPGADRAAHDHQRSHAPKGGDRG